MLNMLMKLSKVKNMYSDEYMQELIKVFEENLENAKEAMKNMEELTNEKN